MVGREIEPDGDPAAQPLAEVELERGQLEHEHALGPGRGRASNTGLPILPPSTASTPAARKQMVDQSGGGRFAVGAGDADDRGARPMARRTDRRRRGSRPRQRAPRRSADAAAGWVSGTPGLGTSERQARRCRPSGRRDRSPAGQRLGAVVERQHVGAGGRQRPRGGEPAPAEPSTPTCRPDVVLEAASSQLQRREADQRQDRWR